MCGIIGAYSPESSGALLNRIDIGISRIRHRGPDDLGKELIGFPDSNMVLGQTRLSIIDLSAAGHQPMASSSGRYLLVYNGEIYNYKELRQELSAKGHCFRSESDSEVLLASWEEWGAACLNRLVGMFAFVVYDRERQSMTCARDAFGIKPFFYNRNAQSFQFASEISALLALIPKRPALNLQQIYEYLVWGTYDDGEKTFYEDIYHLPAGHFLEIDLRNPAAGEPVRWYWPSIAERTDLSFDQAADKLREMFLENVRIHLRSDVPLGAALSGGVDSSALVCCMRHIEPDLDLHTFSFVANGSLVDEEKWADIVIKDVGAIAHKTYVEPSEVRSDMDDLIRAQGEPFGSTSIYAQYRVFKLAKEKGITVTLDGQGADEMLGGYSGYPSAVMHSLLDKREFGGLARFANSWSHWPGRTKRKSVLHLGDVLVPEGMRKRALKLAGFSAEPEWLRVQNLTENGVRITVPPQKTDRSDHEARGRRLAERLRYALVNGDLQSLLRHGDRNSMRWSIESRVPFLTTGLADFLLTLPEDYLVSRAGETKSVFKHAMRGIVPDAILDRRDKVGFATPEKDWLMSEKDSIHVWLEAGRETTYLDIDSCKREVQLVLDGQRKFDFRLWRMINLCRWLALQDA